MLLVLLWRKNPSFGKVVKRLFAQVKNQRIRTTQLVQEKMEISFVQFHNARYVTFFRLFLLLTFPVVIFFDVKSLMSAPLLIHYIFEINLDSHRHNHCHHYHCSYRVNARILLGKMDMLSPKKNAYQNVRIFVALHMNNVPLELSHGYE